MSYLFAKLALFNCKDELFICKDDNTTLKTGYFHLQYEFDTKAIYQKNIDAIKEKGLIRIVSILNILDGASCQNRTSNRSLPWIRYTT